MKIAVIIQARTSSTRLPLKKSKRLNEIIIATTEEKEDNEIIDITKKEDVKYFRGSKENVLSRYYFAAKENNIDIIIRITSDCVDITDLTIDDHINKMADYTSNSLTRTYPHGFDVEVFNFDALEKAYKNATKDYEKEHVTPLIL